MVGRDLPNLCPYGEDHLALRGVRGGGGGSRSRRRRRERASRSLIAMTQIHKALG